MPHPDLLLHVEALTTYVVYILLKHEMGAWNWYESSTDMKHSFQDVNMRIATTSLILTNLGQFLEDKQILTSSGDRTWYHIFYMQALIFV